MFVFFSLFNLFLTFFVLFVRIGDSMEDVVLGKLFPQRVVWSLDDSSSPIPPPVLTCFHHGSLSSSSSSSSLSLSLSLNDKNITQDWMNRL